MSDVKYRQLVEVLKAGIREGKYASGQRIPSVRALIRRFKMSSVTVQHSLDELSRQGFLVRRPGSGTFVTRQGASRKIGLIVPGVAYSEFFSIIVGEITKLATANGYMVLLGDMSSSDVRKRAKVARKFAADLVSESVTGVIYQPFEFIEDADRLNEEIVSVLDDAGIPVVLLDYDIKPPPERSKFDVVGINNMDAGYRLGNHLLDAGAKSIHFLIRPNSSPSIRNRMRGVRTAVHASSRAQCDFGVFLGEPDDLTALKRYLRRFRPDAFVCGGDVAAAMLMKSLAKLGKRVPDDIRLAGVNDLRFTSLLNPPLTTIHQPIAQIAEAAFKRILARVADRSMPPCEMFLPAPLIVRESTARK